MLADKNYLRSLKYARKDAKILCEILFIAHGEN